jgi:hypothetical protein
MQLSLMAAKLAFGMCARGCSQLCAQQHITALLSTL